MSGPRDILCSLGSRSALSVLGALLEGSTTTQQIAGATGLSESRTRHHLMCLHDAGVLSRDHDRIGRKPQIFSVEPDALVYAARWLAALAKNAECER